MPVKVLQMVCLGLRLISFVVWPGNCPLRHDARSYLATGNGMFVASPSPPKEAALNTTEKANRNFNLTG